MADARKVRAIYDALDARLEALVTAERLSPDQVAPADGQELASLIDVLQKYDGWSHEWPEEFARELVRKQVKANIDKPDVVCELSWPFADGPRQGGFDPSNPRLRDMSTSVDTRATWCAQWVSTEFLAEHMPQDANGAASIAKLWSLMRAGLCCDRCRSA